MVAFADLDADVAAWGFYLDVASLEARGPAAGLARAGAGGGRLRVRGTGRGALGGETLAWNTPVIALHRRFGFAVGRTYEVVVDGAPQEVVWTQRDRED